MKRYLLLALVILTSASFNTMLAQSKKSKKKGKAATVTQLVTPEDSLSYAAGMEATKGLKSYLKQQFGVEEADMPEFIRGYEETVAALGNMRGKGYSAGVQLAGMVAGRIIGAEEKNLTGALTADTLNSPLFNKGFIASLRQDHSLLTDSTAAHITQAAQRATAEKAMQLSKNFMAQNGKKEGVITRPSGLQYKVLRQGNGPVASADDEVVVKYEGRLIDGTVFDSSYERNPQTSTFRPNQVIKGWTEALTLMPQGSKWELYIPQELAYGAREAGKIPAYSPLIFIVVVDEVKAKSDK